MKKIILSAIILLAFGIIGCNSNGSDPKGVLKSFLDALSKKDIEGAKKFATKDSETMLGMMQMMLSMAPKDSKDIPNTNDMEFGDTKIDGDKATVSTKEKKSGETTIYNLRKEDGSWKVAFTKDAMPGGDKMKNMNSNGMDKMNEGMDSASKMMQDMNKMNDTDTSH